MKKVDITELFQKVEMLQKEIKELQSRPVFVDSYTASPFPGLYTSHDIRRKCNYKALATVYNKFHKKEIRTIKIGRHTFVTEADFEEFNNKRLKRTA